MTTSSQLHGARWPRFNCVQMIETMSLAAAVAKKDDKEHSVAAFCMWHRSRIRYLSKKNSRISTNFRKL